jgi:hypothetical protein
MLSKFPSIYTEEGVSEKTGYTLGAGSNVDGYHEHGAYREKRIFC